MNISTVQQMEVESIRRRDQKNQAKIAVIVEDTIQTNNQNQRLAEENVTRTQSLDRARAELARLEQEIASEQYPHPKNTSLPNAPPAYFISNSDSN